MRSETIAIHAGYEVDPATKSVAVPIYQTAAYAFDSADHGAALFNLEAKGFRYSRIANPTTAVLTRLVNVGDAKSLACHPTSTTHRQMSPDERRKAGVLPETIRLSIGIEHIADIIEDLDQALEIACPQRRLEAAE